MSPRLRKFALTAHIVSSVGWLGAVIAFLPLAVAVIISRDVETIRAAYLAMELIGWFALVPLSLASLLTGLVMAFGTHWGLFRHYWVVAKFLINIASVVILLKYMQRLSDLAGVAASPALSTDDLALLQHPSAAVHAALALLALLLAVTLSVYKPRGTPTGGVNKRAPQASMKGLPRPGNK